MKYGSFFTIIFIVLFSTNIRAEDVQSLQEIERVATDFAYRQAQLNAQPEQINIQPGQLDQRLRLVACQSGLEAFIPPGTRMMGNTTVGIRCSTPKAWSIYIPMRISVYQSAVVLLRPVRRGELISESDVQLEKVDISLLRGQPVQSIDAVIGSKAKNSLSSGTVLNEASICVICKGDSVSITVDNPSIAIVMSGVALTDGAIGERIRVQNSASKRIVEAIIVNEDTVKVSI